MDRSGRWHGGRAWLVAVVVLALASGSLPGASPSVASAEPDLGALIDPARAVPQRAAERTTPPPAGLLVRRAPAVPVAALEEAVEDEGLELGEPVGVDDWWRVEVPDEVDLDDAAADLDEVSAVVDVVEDHVRTASRTPNDPLYAEFQAYLRTIRAPAAWADTTGSADVVVAVLDTGIWAAHPDLQGKVVSGRSFVPGTTSTHDDEGHGTAVAGLIAARTNDGSGIAGLGWNTRVMPVKVLDALGRGTDGDVAQGIRWAADRGVAVINLSLGGPEPSPVLDAAVAYARTKGVVVVAAAGNDSLDEPNYPAASPGALAVGATDQQGRLAALTNHGDWIDLVAPGFDVLTTSAGRHHYEIVDGTSFAAPLVAGAAALVRARHPSLSGTQVETRLRTTARDAGPRGIDPFYGHGVLDVAAAVGRPFAAPFPLPARGDREPDDLAARATPLGVGQATATLAPEGDVDWFRVEVDRATTLSIRLDAPGPDWADGRWIDPVLELYDEEQRLLAYADDGYVGDPELLEGRVHAGTYLVRVSNWYPSAGRAPYTVRLATAPAPEPAGFHPYETWTVSGPGVDAYAVGTAISDATGDGYPDLLLTTRGGSLELHAGNADGSHAPAVRVAVPDLDPSVAPVAVARLDRDGPPHVLVGTSAGLRSFRWDGEGLTTGATLDPGRIVDLAVGDTDGDGLDDIVAGIATGGLDTWVHQIDVTQTPPVRRLIRHERGGVVPLVAVGDVDGDGRDEVVTALAVAIAVHPRISATQYGNPVRRTVASVGGSRHVILGLAVGDTDGDGRADVHVTGGGYGDAANAQRFAGTATGSLSGLGSAEVTTGLHEFPGIATVGDVTGDGVADLVVAHPARETLSVVPGTGGGPLGEVLEAQLPDVASYPAGALSVGDLDADDWNDVVIAGGVPMAVLRNLAGGEHAGDDSPADHWVRDAEPAVHGTGVGREARLSVTLARDVTAASAGGAGVVRLVDTRSGRAVGASVALDGPRRLLVTPGSPLVAGTPYALRVDGLRSPEGDEQDEPLYLPFVAARDTTAPGPVTAAAAASTAPGRVRVSWTNPAVADLDLVEVRATDTTTWPTTTTGTLVYRGRGSSFTLDGLDPKRVRSYAVWALDRSGNRSSRVTVRLDGTTASASRSTTKLTHGERVEVRGTLTGAAAGRAVGGRTVELWERRAPATTWTRVATATSASDGTVRFTRTPPATTAYRLRAVGGSAAVTLEVSAGTVSVAPRVTAAPSRTSVARNGSLTVSGTVRPTSLAGRPVELQRLRDGSWVRVQRSTIRSDGTVRFTSVPTGSRGTFTYRVLVPATDTHTAGASPRFAVTVQ